METNKTILDNNNKTLVENVDITILEKEIKKSNFITLSNFKDYKVLKPLSNIGAESDNFLLEKFNKKYFLKLYRFGVNPNKNIINKIVSLSKQYQNNFVTIHDFDFDPNLERWYEVQEYIPSGSLEFYTQKKDYNLDIEAFIQSIVNSLSLLHANNILHLDLKPSNILVKGNDFLFTDFGISSLINSDVSRKLTAVKGTPLYWSPESFTGIVGKEADYWALGIMLMELIIGENPFANIDTKVIIYTLSTKGISIPSQIEKKFKHLLEGLLTREPNKRWGFNEVNKWLKGDEQIPTYYSFDKNSKYTPFKYNDKNIYSIKELIENYLNDENNWEKLKKDLFRGTITSWLTKNQENDIASYISYLCEKYDSNTDLATFKIIYRYCHNLPIIILGKILTLETLENLCEKVLKDTATTNELNLFDLFVNNQLQYYINSYIEETQNLEYYSKVFDNLFLSIKSVHTIAEIAHKLKKTLEIVLHHFSDYLLPKDFDSFSKEEKTIFLIKTSNVLIKKDEFDKIIQKYYLPEALFKLKQINSNNFLEIFEFIKNKCDFFLTTKDFIVFKNDKVLDDDILNIKNMNLKEFIFAFENSLLIYNNISKKYLTLNDYEKSLNISFRFFNTPIEHQTFRSTIIAGIDGLVSQKKYKEAIHYFNLYKKKIKDITDEEIIKLAELYKKNKQYNDSINTYSLIREHSLYKKEALYDSGKIALYKVRNEVKAMEYFLKGTKLNCDKCNYMVGLIYENGWGVGKDIQSAKVFYDNAQNLGNTNATSRLKIINSNIFIKALTKYFLIYIGLYFSVLILFYFATTSFSLYAAFLITTILSIAIYFHKKLD